MTEPHSTIRPQPGILDIEPYKGGEARLAGHATVLKLSSNENPFGPSPRAQEAFARAALSLHLYPDSSHAALRAAIAEVHGLDSDRMICGDGSGEIHSLLCQAYAGPGTDVIHTEHGFGLYRIYALAASATSCPWPQPGTSARPCIGCRSKYCFIGGEGTPLSQNTSPLR
jgi:histidinol-phosphate aminotransferase